jgi:uncharacterized protein (DUF4415 family)
VSNKNIRTISLEELLRMKERGELHHDPEAPKGPPPGEELPDDFWQKAVVETPAKPRAVLLNLTPDVFDWFYRESNGKGHITRMQNVLRAYVRAKSHEKSQRGG